MAVDVITTRTAKKRAARKKARRANERAEHRPRHPTSRVADPAALLSLAVRGLLPLVIGGFPPSIQDIIDRAMASDRERRERRCFEHAACRDNPDLGRACWDKKEEERA